MASKILIATDELKAEGERALGYVAIKCDEKGVKVSKVLVRGYPADEIIKTASSEKPEFIVVGSLGKTGLEHLFIGSVSEAVIKKAPCPVLPFLSDDEESIDRMIGLAKEYGADYVLLGGLTLFGDRPGDSKADYYEALEKHYPALMPEYRKMFGSNFYPSRVYQEELNRHARDACRRYGIRYGILPSDC